MMDSVYRKGAIQSKKAAHAGKHMNGDGNKFGDYISEYHFTTNTRFIAMDLRKGGKAF